jgi:hypothetical protein
MRKASASPRPPLGLPSLAGSFMWKTEMAGPSDPIGVHELPQRPLPYPPSTGASARRAYFAGAAVLKITRLAPRRPLLRRHQRLRRRRMRRRLPRPSKDAVEHILYFSVRAQGRGRQELKASTRSSLTAAALPSRSLSPSRSLACSLFRSLSLSFARSLARSP